MISAIKSYDEEEYTATSTVVTALLLINFYSPLA